MRRALLYGGIVLVALAVHLALREVDWRRGDELHTVLEVVAGLVALMVMKIALVRYYSRRTDRFLLLGVAFLGTGILDLYHGLAGSGILGEGSHALEMAAQSWGWIASRLFLATLVLAAVFQGRQRESEEHLDPRLVYAGAGVLILLFLGILSAGPLPASYVPSLGFRRLLELVPAACFLTGLVVFLRRGGWRTGAYDHWLVLSLLTGFLGQAVFMGFARGPLDPLVVAGHVAKIVGYLCVLFGLLSDMYALFRRADLTTAKLARANAALQAEALERTRVEEERDRFFELSLDLLCISGMDGYFKLLSPAWEKTLGWTLRELLDRPFWEIIHPEDLERTEEVMQKLRLGVPVLDFEVRMRTRDGTWRWLAWRAASLPEKGLSYGVARDVHERKRVEQMKNDFVSVVSHELRTPLTSIRGSLGLLAGGVAGNLPDKANMLLDIAAKNSERLVRLINDILDIEKIESGEMGFRLIPQSLMALVEQGVEANQAYGQPYGISLRILESVNGVRVRADGDRIQQVLTNLLSNAVKFSPRGGVVEIGVTAANGRARIRVTDHGRGIPRDFQMRIFEKFAQADATSTRQQGGTGLGLSISKAIVERHGGRIWFETAEGGGTSFFVELPEWLAPVQETGPDAAETANPVPSLDDTIVFPRPQPMARPEGGARILVCEDDPDVAHLLVMMLREDGFEADVALNATEARRLLAQGEYAAMTLDLILPGEDGVSLLRELRRDEAGQQLPVVVVSARAQEGKSELNGGAIGVIDWLVKPIDHGRLSAAVQRAVRGKDPADRPCILHVEDDDDVQRVVTAIVENDGAEVERARDLAEARALLAQRPFDLVILDLALPDGSGMDLLPLIGTLSPPTPVIIFSAHEVDGPVASRVASVLIKSQTSNRELVQKIQAVLGR